ncbi:hypothetical protein FRZ67_06440 [Panacibacter ginsenosidivorans]|uniref:Uncharacterized protein n=1 Tax=Panacibacter ginsenosidivorans TaxID=1813871 RepID=A0A5B8V7S4_9BACT|nr:hypothetical protein [Panacibacter ginsenosidivorans]QEC66953.1 hypothetical protein FRZ67_06440 [Panacibacter ginsenosidivorans]
MKQILFAFFTTSWLLLSCAKQTETVNLPALSDYYPLQTGKVFIYKLDSLLIPISGGSELEVKSYHARDSIADTIRDNIGRLSYRVYRSITDTLESQPWKTIGSYYITPEDNTVEVMDENNLRFIKLKEPLRNDYNWQGNSYIDTRSASSSYQFMDGWNYIYQNAAMPYTVLMGELPNTITVLQEDETSPPGDFDPNSYQQRNYSIEVYAYGIGLVYKEFLHWTWQTTPPPAKFDNDSYGIRLNLISYR